MLVPSTVRVFAATVAGRTPDEVLSDVVSAVEAEGVVVVESSATPVEGGHVDVVIRWESGDEPIQNEVLVAVGTAIWAAANPDAAAALR